MHQQESERTINPAQEVGLVIVELVEGQLVVVAKKQVVAV